MSEAYLGDVASIPVQRPGEPLSTRRSGPAQWPIAIVGLLVSVGLLLAMFPYLWLWKLVPATLGRLLWTERVRRMLIETVPPALPERHELDPFRTDTVDGALFTAHLSELALQLGPDVAADDVAMGHIAPVARARPHPKGPLWEEDFPAMVERIGRKCLLVHVGNRWPILKGHFLAAAPAPGPSHRCVIRFDDYVRDLGATLDRVYAECMGG